MQHRVPNGEAHIVVGKLAEYLRCKNEEKHDDFKSCRQRYIKFCLHKRGQQKERKRQHAQKCPSVVLAQNHQHRYEKHNRPERNIYNKCGFFRAVLVNHRAIKEFQTVHKAPPFIVYHANVKNI